MAANLQGKGAIGLGKRLTNQIWAVAAASSSASAAARRGVHASAYDKNPDEQVRASAVPDDVIQPQSDKYWGPHPTTGVFGPADPNGHADAASAVTSAASGGGASALDQTAWFRPAEGVEKPHHA
ncbi:hypothetical protein Taro_055170 [Colocasia esculenta]|uniref:Late embryogenesis abundant protein n=1 Tax=Colocasia esculenta TaxID=4460 RepID=A0A843XST0_COLES|nr:hypothetical protein [Colocasia esculenta]